MLSGQGITSDSLSSLVPGPCPALHPLQKSGEQCKRAVKEGDQLCFQHVKSK